jgi:hypothetical protein
MLPLSSIVLALALCWSHAAAHTVIVYPGWRGNNLQTNGTFPDGSVPPGSLGQNWDQEAGGYNFPYGMQWMYPCTFSHSLLSKENVLYDG